MCAYKKKGNIFRGVKPNPWIMGVLIFALIMFATVMFLWIRGEIARKDFHELSMEIHGTEPITVQTTPVSSETIELPTIVDETIGETVLPTEKASDVMLEKYVEAYNKNPEFFGWIRMEGTELDYPVMLASDGNNEKYLHLNFDGGYSAYGVPFADIKCSRDSDNILIYGHNESDGSMFRSLFKYEDEDYFKEHPELIYSDLYGDYSYEILSVFYDRIYLKTDTCFKYYQFVDAENEEDFNYAISQFKEKSLYDTGVEAKYGDKLISLITCSYHTDNGRFVVVARRK